MTRIPLVAPLFALACGAAPPESAASPAESVELAPPPEAHAVTARAPSRRLFGASRWEPRVLASPEPPPPPPVGVQRRVDVRLQGAELGEALRFLADTGRFALVAEGELRGRVDVDLRRVRPYDALVAIAEAHGAQVRRKGPIVVVTAR